MSRQSRWILTVSFVVSVGAVPQVRADLFEYVRRPDDAFAWKTADKQTSAAGTAYSLQITSQVWQGITWEHQLRLYEPAEIKYPNAMLLFITGGSSTSKPKPEDALLGFGLAKLCGARCAFLAQVPNQPLLDGKKEDALIAETFVRYLDTGDENWPLLFPMVKSAVRAMDALEQWAEQEGKEPPTQFVVTGASKRGWTTWLTAAVDHRVAAIAPMVIDTLNMRAQMRNQKKVWGKYSEQIDDYTKRGLQERIEDPDGERLWKMVDPYTFRDRLTMPKLLINGTNDPYWTLDALNLYWDDLVGAKHVVYLPNAGHGLDQHRDYALNGVAALFRHTVTKRPLPSLEWKHSEAADGMLRVTVSASPEPKAAQLWVARSESLDFRRARWESSPMRPAASFVGEVPRPDSGYAALFGDLEFEIDELRYHLTTQIGQSGAKLAR